MPLFQCCRHRQVVITSSMFWALLLKEIYTIHCHSAYFNESNLLNGHLPFGHSCPTCVPIEKCICNQRQVGIIHLTIYLFYVYWWILNIFPTSTYLISRRGGFPFSKTFSEAFEDRQPVTCAKVNISFANDILKYYLCCNYGWNGKFHIFVMSICATAETGSRVGPFYRSSHSPQYSGQRDPWCFSHWHIFCLHSTCKTQRWGHTLADQGEIIRNEV